MEISIFVVRHCLNGCPSPVISLCRYLRCSTLMKSKSLYLNSHWEGHDGWKPMFDNPSAYASGCTRPGRAAPPSAIPHQRVDRGPGHDDVAVKITIPLLAPVLRSTLLLLMSDSSNSMFPTPRQPMDVPVSKPLVLLLAATANDDALLMEDQGRRRRRPTME
jgi:hypothetical protein